MFNDIVGPLADFSVLVRCCNLDDRLDRLQPIRSQNCNSLIYLSKSIVDVVLDECSLRISETNDHIDKAIPPLKTADRPLCVFAIKSEKEATKAPRKPPPNHGRN